MLYAVGEKLARWDIRQNAKNYPGEKTASITPVITKIESIYKSDLIIVKYGKPRVRKGWFLDIII
ncbi:MAG: hypothetical protein KGZ96_06595 [Clostridia bacterium]|jgi:hypothetical protein|nr:hypothetical protein [Clostridia bacterium]